MKALLRYAIVKGLREKDLFAVLFGPMMLAGSVAGGFMVHAFVTGDRLNMDNLTTNAFEIGTLTSVLAGGFAAFRAFRKELADRSVASLVLASRPSVIVLTAIAYGVASGIIALTLAFLTISAVTFAFSFPATLFLLGCFAILVASAAAITGCSISPDPGILVPELIVVFPLSVAIGMQKTPALAAGAVMVLALPLIASALVERRCAA